jgi:hypothetical protein
MFCVNEKQLIFDGNVSLYLYGNGALKPIGAIANNISSYYIGGVQSNLIIHDHRPEVVSAAQLVLGGHVEINFADVFNQDARAEIRYQVESDAMEIDLYEGSSGVQLPILWIGVLDNNRMPAYKVEWEVFKALEPNRTAFAALVP